VRIARPLRVANHLPACIACDGIDPQDSMRAETLIGDGGSAAGSIGAGGVSIRAGVAYTFTQRDTYSEFVDFNGDGLPDQVTRAPGYPAFEVQFNHGDGTFDSTIVPYLADTGWRSSSGTTLLDPARDGISHGFSNDENAEGGFSAELGFMACVAAGLNLSGVHADIISQLDLQDMDGDGLVDHVLKLDGDPHYYVRLQPNYRSNLLHTVSTPLGGSFELGYARQGNNVGMSTEPETSERTRADMPHSQWVLSSVTVRDGRQSGGSLPTDPDTSSHHEYRQQFEYFNSGFYDRAERENYGYAHIRITRDDDSISDIRFYNQDYYRRGHVQQVAELDDNYHLLRAERTEIADPPALPLRTGSYFPAETEHRTLLFDAVTFTTPLPAEAMSTTRRRHFDANGNLDVEWDQGEPATSDDDVIGVVSYFNVPDLNVWVVKEVFEFAYPTGGASCNPLTDSSCRGEQLRARFSNRRSSDGVLTGVTQWLSGGRNLDGGVYTGSQATNPRWEFVYDAYGNVVTVRDPSTVATGAAYLTYDIDADFHQFRISIIDVFGYKSGADYDYRFGTVASTGDINGNKERFTYDSLGRVTEVYGPYDAATTTPTVRFQYAIQPGGYSYPVWGLTQHRMDGTSDTLDNVNFVDGVGRQIESKADADVEGHGVGLVVSGRVGFDVRGRVNRESRGAFSDRPITEWIELPEDHVTQRSFDTLSRPTSVIFPDLTSIQTAYGFETDAGVVLQSTTVTDALSRTSTTLRSIRDTIAQVRQQNTIGGVRTDLTTTYAYDPLGQLLAVTDAAGNVTTASYNSLGQMIVLASPDAGRTEYLYSSAGDLAARETPRLREQGQLIRYDRTHHRLDQINYPDRGPAVFTYGAPGATGNRAGRIATRSNYAGSESFQYGRLGEIVQSTRTLTSSGIYPAETVTMSYSFDSFGRIRTLTYPNNDVLTYTYNAGGLLSAVSGSKSGTIVGEIRYDQFGQRSYIRYGNGVETTYTHDPNMERLSDVATTTPVDGRVQQLHYAYTPVGNIDSLKNTIPQQTISGPTAFSFEYDDLDQLTHATGSYQSLVTSRDFVLDMEYDRIGNITRNYVKASSGGLVDDALSRDNQYAYSYATGRPHAPDSIGSRAISYDDDGNQESWADSYSGENRSYEWDSDDRLANVSTPTDNVSFRYDSDGQRTHKNRNAVDVSMYFNQFYSLRNGEVSTSNIFAGNERVASIVISDDDPRTYFYHSDHLQSAQYISDTSGAVYQHIEYLPFGEPWMEETAGSDATPGFRFTGKEFDPETGLYYFGARYYDPRTALWVSPDPILASYLDGAPNGGVYSPVNLGLYTYSFNSPVRLRDPDGRCPVADAAICAEGLGDKSLAYSDVASGPVVSSGRGPSAPMDTTTAITAATLVVAVGAVVTREEGAAVDLAAAGPVQGGEPGARNAQWRMQRSDPGNALGEMRPAPPPLINFEEPVLQLPALSSASIGEMEASANAPLRFGPETRVGSAIQSHATRPGTSFTSASTVGERARQGAAFIHGLLNDPRAQVTSRMHRAYGAIVDVRLPSGVGARWRADGTFMGVLDPPVPRSPPPGSGGASER
jgi:RHS repeat-associated protein